MRETKRLEAAEQKDQGLLVDALEAALHEAGHACCCEKPHSGVGVSLHESDCWTAKARAALKAAGRLP